MKRILILIFLVAVSFASYAQTATGTDAPAADIVDNAYDGTLGTMASSSIMISGVPGGATITNITVDVDIAHTWAGDITIKLEAPNGDILGLMSRPSLDETNDDGTQCCGTSDDMTGSISFNDAFALSAEDFDDDASPLPTEYQPAPGSVTQPPSTLADLYASPANGNWTLHVGDSGGGDSGTFNAWTITIEYTAAPPGGGGPTCHLACPAGPITYNLGSGECNATYDYTMAIVGDCLPELIPAPAVPDFSADFATILSSQNDGCFELTAASLTMSSFDFGTACTANPFFATYTEFQVPTNGTITFDWNYTTNDLNAQWDPFGYFFNASSTVLSVPNIEAGITALTDAATADQAGSATVNVASGDLFSFLIYTLDGQFGASNVEITNFVFQPDDVLTYYTAVPSATTPVLGEALAPGTTTVSYDLVAPNGTVEETCEFDLVVNEFAGVSAQLNCVPNHNFSFDENCQVTITPADILQGENYGCFDNYTVNILSNTGSAQNPVGSPLGNVADHSFVGESWTVQIMSNLDPSNMCMVDGVNFFDGIAPVISCGDLTPVTEFAGALADGPYGLDLANEPTGCWSGVSTFIDNAHPYQAYTFTVTTAGSYSFEMDGIADGLAAIFSGVFDPADLCAGFIAGDDDGGTGLNPLVVVDLTPGVYTFVATNTSFGNPVGDFTVSIDGPAQVEVSSADITISCTESVDGVALPTATDNCSDVSNISINLISQGWLDAAMCDDGKKVYQRTYRAVDEAGKQSAPCTQTITVTQPTITFPEDITWTCDQYAAHPGVIGAAALHGNISDWDTGDVQNDIDVNPNMSNFVLNNTGSGLPSPVGSNDNSCNFNVEHSDQTFPHCGGAPGVLKIHRLWTITNICTGAIQTHTQLIVVADIDAPVMDFTNLAAFSTDAQGNVTLTVSANGSYPNTCNSTSFIPTPGFSDNCSGLDMTTMSVTTPAGVLTGMTANGGYIPAPGLAVGVYTDGLTYQITDNCGNTAEVKVTLIVQDDVAPTMACDVHTTVTLNNTGAGILQATSPDDGSYDNCGIVGFEIRRMANDNPCVNSDKYFGTFVTFCCEDVDATHMVVVQATDVYGNSNICMVEVEVKDKTAPTCLAPADAQVDCNSFDIDNLVTSFGDVIAADNCSYDVVENVNNGVDGCGKGIVTRTWTVTDGGGLVTTCSQKITVNYVQNYSVKFPNDLNITACTSNPFDTIAPIFGDNDCEQGSYEVTDEVITSVPGACYKILRTFEIFDWCDANTLNYTPEQVANPSYTLSGPTVHTDATNHGRFIYTQIIMVTDNDLPTVEVIEDEYCVAPGGCIADVVLKAKAQDACSGDNIEFSYILYMDLNGDGDYTDAGETTHDDDAFAPNITILHNGGWAFASIKLKDQPVGGVHKIKWFAEDNCGNSSDDSFTFEVKDCKKPTIEATDGTVNIMSDGNGGGMITLWPGNPVDCWQTVGAPNVCAWNPNVGDNCTADEALYIRVQKADGPNAGQTPPVTATSVTYTCGDLGTQEVELWVGDEAGNWDFITVLITIEDNMGICGGTPISAPISGAMMMASNSSEGVQDVEVTVADVAGNVPSSTVTSSYDGAYGVSGLPLANNYTITPTHDGTGAFAKNGVSVIDLLLIYQQILGGQQLSDYQKLAADVDNSGSVQPADLILIRDLILGKINAFPNTPAWRFYEASCDASGAATCPEVIDIATLAQGGVTTADFVAVKMGDVSGDAAANMYSSVDDRTFGELVLNTADRMLSAGEEVEITLHANRNDIAGYQFTLNIGNMEFVNVKGNNVSIDNFGLHLDKSSITASWTGATLENDVFTIVLRATQDGRLSDALSLNGEITPSMAFDTNNDKQDVKLAFDGKVVDQFTLFQNEPNPFSDRTEIKFYLPVGTAATLTVFDAAGRTLKTINNDFAKGMNQVSIAKSELNAVGVLYYKLETDSNTAIKKMIIME